MDAVLRPPAPTRFYDELEYPDKKKAGQNQSSWIFFEVCLPVSSYCSLSKASRGLAAVAVGALSGPWASSLPEKL